jgi:hypothetical protein
LQVKQFTPNVKLVVRNMTVALKVDASALMVASNIITLTHAAGLAYRLKAQ